MPQKGPKLWLAMLFWILLGATAQALELRVAIEESVSQVKVGSTTKAVVRDAAGKRLGEIAPMNAFYAQANGGGVVLDRWRSTSLWVEPDNNGYVWIGERWYRGRTRVVLTDKGLTAINYVDLEKYLYSVLGGEVYANWPQEALKAQAVAARTYALYQRQTRGNSTYDLGDTIAWQVYKGIESEAPPMYSAVDTTAGQVVTYNGKIILAAFHSSSGGHTENVENVWSDNLPYLRGVPDFDGNTPEAQWVKNFTREELSSRISGVGNVLSMTPERTSPFGRIITMKVIGDRSSRVISGPALRLALGLRSTWFTVTADTAGKSVPSTFRIEGRGYGHGLGLSQWGAYSMARQGANYQQIVRHYYQNTTLAKIKVVNESR
ncbi:SpoIID/LytB domain-containing protein [Argonema galeatum]|uniref:SpoIID/LytB domain-containing protein n=1 Tax=Argonema galeatum TaxID=2942762 RepID=UPI002012ACB2|nr:SpoIID/LytB domain-containing protein [Argonema galeatum]MCL1464061.1 SpoIID/LytB domain-containing protein [Argonema galeatum A003/A1]